MHSLFLKILVVLEAFNNSSFNFFFGEAKKNQKKLMVFLILKPLTATAKRYQI